MLKLILLTLLSLSVLFSYVGCGNTQNEPLADRGYDFIIASGGGYNIVARLRSNTDGESDLVGVVDDDGNWLHPLSANHPLIGGDGLIRSTRTSYAVTAFDVSDSVMESVRNQTRRNDIRSSFRHYEGAVFSLIVSPGENQRGFAVQVRTARYFDASQNILIDE